MKSILAKAASAAKNAFSAVKNVVGQVVTKATDTVKAVVTKAKEVVANVENRVVAVSTAVQAVTKNAVAKTIGSAQHVAAKSASAAVGAAHATATVLKAAAVKAKGMGAKVIDSPIIQCPLHVIKDVATQKNYWPTAVGGELAGKFVFDPVLDIAGKVILKPSTVKGAANLIKAAGMSVKPILKEISPGLSEMVGKATNKGTVNAIGKSLRAFAKTTAGKVVGDAAVGAISGPIIEFASRAIQDKPLFTKPAVFNYGSAAVKGAISAAIAGAIIGSVAPGPGTVVGFAAGLGIGLAGLAIGIGTSFLVDCAAKPIEDTLRTKMHIKDE